MKAERFYATIGFLSCLMGWLGLLFGSFLFWIFPVPIYCGYQLLRRRTAKRDILSGASCLIVGLLLLAYLVTTIRQ